MPVYKTPKPKRVRGMQWMEVGNYIREYYQRRGRFYWSSTKRAKDEKALKKSYGTRKRKYRRKLVVPSIEIIDLTLDD
jgi:hypothetical protein